MKWYLLFTIAKLACAFARFGINVWLFLLWILIRAQSHSADVYSFMVILWFLVSKNSLFHATLNAHSDTSNQFKHVLCSVLPFDQIYGRYFMLFVWLIIIIQSFICAFKVKITNNNKNERSEFRNMWMKLDLETLRTL